MKEVSTPEPRQRLGVLGDYLQRSRDPANAVLFVIPLFVAYQIGILFSGGIRNGVDFLTSALFFILRDIVTALTGEASTLAVLLAYVALNICILLGLLLALRLYGDSSKTAKRLWPWMLLESTIYGLLFATAVNALISLTGLDFLLAAGGIEDMNILQRLVTSLGAGLYEEIVFRVFVLSGIVWILHKRMNIPKIVAAIVGVLVSSLVFSAIHHVGAMADPFTLSVFTFRFFAGFVLATIYAARGFGIAVYTHAIYDIWVLCF